MTIKVGIIQRLDTAVANAAVHPNKIPQGTTGRRIAVEQIGGAGEEHSEGKATVQQAEFVIHCIGDTEFQADELAEDVRVALQAIPRATQLGNVNQRGVFIDDIRDSSSPPQQGDEVGFPSKEVRVTVFYVP